jgi:hypothetical protein
MHRRIRKKNKTPQSHGTDTRPSLYTHLTHTTSHTPHHTPHIHTSHTMHCILGRASTGCPQLRQNRHGAPLLLISSSTSSSISSSPYLLLLISSSPHISSHIHLLIIHLLISSSPPPHLFLIYQLISSAPLPDPATTQVSPALSTEPSEEESAESRCFRDCLPVDFRGAAGCVRCVRVSSAETNLLTPPAVPVPAGLDSKSLLSPLLPLLPFPRSKLFA